MAHTINFNNVKKHYLSVTLADEKNTVIMVGTPTKAILSNLLLLQSGLEAVDDDGANIDALDTLYAACANVMSRNKTGVKITKEMLEEIFDFEDIKLFFKAYMNFVAEVANQKN